MSNIAALLIKVLEEQNLLNPTWRENFKEDFFFYQKRGWTCLTLGMFFKAHVVCAHYTPTLISPLFISWSHFYI